MTWGVTKDGKENSQNEKQASIDAVPNRSVSVVSVGGHYGSYPKAIGYATGVIQLVCGILSILFGIPYEIMAMKMGAHFHGWYIWAGILYTIAGSLCVVSASKRTRGRILAASILTIFAALVAASAMGCMIWKLVRIDGEHRHRFRGHSRRPYDSGRWSSNSEGRGDHHHGSRHRRGAFGRHDEMDDDMKVFVGFIALIVFLIMTVVQAVSSIVHSIVGFKSLKDERKRQNQGSRIMIPVAEVEKAHPPSF